MEARAWRLTIVVATLTSVTLLVRFFSCINDWSCRDDEDALFLMAFIVPAALLLMFPLAVSVVHWILDGKWRRPKLPWKPNRVLFSGGNDQGENGDQAADGRPAFWRRPALKWVGISVVALFASLLLNGPHKTVAVFVSTAVQVAGIAVLYLIARAIGRQPRK